MGKLVTYIKEEFLGSRPVLQHEPDPLSIPGLSYLIDDRCAVGEDGLTDS